MRELRQSSLVDYREYWVRFLRGELCPVIFPREMFSTRAVVTTVDEYLRVLSIHSQVRDCYVSLYSLPQIERRVVDTVFFEIDGANLQDACVKLEEALTLLSNYECRVYWSGRRGFHVYLDFPPTPLEHPSLAIRSFLSVLRGIPDPHTVGNIRQLVRVPYTVHAKSGLIAGRVDPSNLKATILVPLPERGPAINPGLGESLREIDEKIKEERLTPGEIASGIDAFPPCILHIIETVERSGDLSHQGRLHLTAFLLHVGFSASDIHRILESARDYNPGTTDYQINAIQQAKLRCYSCVRMRELGLCPLEDLDRLDCPWYPSINLFLTKGKSPVKGL